MQSGVLVHLPFAGGVWEQPEEVLYLMGIARRAWYIWGYKQPNSIEWNAADAEFMAWVAGDDGE